MSEKTAHEHEGDQVSARTVVVAEDEALIRLDIVEILKDQGFEVVAETDNGKTAIELAKKHHPDLVLMDVKMPIMDGITAAEEIGKEKIAPVVLLTAFSRKSWWIVLLKLGPWHLWSSPLLLMTFFPLSRWRFLDMNSCVR